MKRKYTGDGGAFQNAVLTSGKGVHNVIEDMKSSMGTFYRLYAKHIWDYEEKAAAAKALGKTIEEIFGTTPPPTPEETPTDTTKYKGDGLLLHTAVSKSGMSVPEVLAKFKVSQGTLYNYYRTVEFDEDLKEKTAKALRKSVEDIFGQEEEETPEIKPGQNKEVIPLGKHVPNRLKPGEYIDSFAGWEGLPMYNVPITASFVESYRDDARYKPQYYFYDPRFKDCDFGAIITGDSMHSEIRHGDFVVCKEITDKRFIVYGEIYYVVSTNGLETCKYVNLDMSNPDNLLLVPKNEKISPSPIPKDMIQKLYKVRGIVRGY